MHIYIKSFVLVCLMFFIGQSILEAQCPRQRLPFIGVSPSGPNTTDDIRIIVAKEYLDACTGLQNQELINVDENTGKITVRFDEFCLNDSTCAQTTHCDTAHFVIGTLPLGTYEVIVIDANNSNDDCVPPTTVDTLDKATFTVKDIFLSAPTVSAQKGSRQCLSYVVNGFDELIDLQASMVFDSNLVRFDTVQNIYPLDFLTPFSVNSPKPNEVRFIWLDELVLGKSIPNDNILFDLCFNVIGNAGDTAILDFVNGPLAAKATTTNDVSYDVITTNGVIYIEEDRYPACTGSNEDILCTDWLKDTVENRIRDFCGGQAEQLSVEVIDWRGWNLIRVTSRDVSGTEPIGQSEYYSCSGETVGICYIGGNNDGICTNIALYEEPGLGYIWQCGEALPGCYTTSVVREIKNAGILEFNLVSDFLLIKKEVSGQSYVTSSAGNTVLTLTGNGRKETGALTPGVYYIQNGSSVERFVVVQQ